MYLKKTILFLSLLSVNALLFAQVAQQDVLYLKNGSIIKGTIEEIDPQENVKIKTADGSLFVFSMSEVTKITKDKVATTTPPVQVKAPPPAPPLKQVDNQPDQSGYAPYSPVRTTATTYREPVLSCLASVFIPGLGQIYNGQTGKGLAFMGWYFGSTILMYSAAVSSNSDGALIATVLGGALSTIAAWLTAVIEAPITSGKINKQLGFAHLKIGKHSTLSLAPDLQMQTLPSSTLHTETSPVMGVSLRLSF